MVDRMQIIVHDALVRIQELFYVNTLEAPDKSTKYKSFVAALSDLVTDCQLTPNDEAQSYDKIRKAIEHINKGKTDEWLIEHGYSGHTIRKAHEQRDKKAVHDKMSSMKCRTCGAKIFRNRENTCVACSTKTWMERQ